jgi:hypothetical protein
MLEDMLNLGNTAFHEALVIAGGIVHSVFAQVAIGFSLFQALSYLATLIGYKLIELVLQGSNALSGQMKFVVYYRVCSSHISIPFYTYNHQ